MKNTQMLCSPTVSLGKAPADLKDNILSCYLNMHTMTFLKHLSSSSELPNKILPHKPLSRHSALKHHLWLPQQPKTDVREELGSAEGCDEQVRASPHYV